MIWGFVPAFESAVAEPVEIMPPIKVAAEKKDVRRLRHWDGRHYFAAITPFYVTPSCVTYASCRGCQQRQSQHSLNRSAEARYILLSGSHTANLVLPGIFVLTGNRPPLTTPVACKKVTGQTAPFG
jgi:hypothetical protein